MNHSAVMLCLLITILTSPCCGNELGKDFDVKELPAYWTQQRKEIKLAGMRATVYACQSESGKEQVQIAIEQRNMPTDGHRVASTKAYVNTTIQKLVKEGYKPELQTLPKLENFDFSEPYVARFTFSRTTEELSEKPEMLYVESRSFFAGFGYNTTILTSDPGQRDKLSQWANELKPKNEFPFRDSARKTVAAGRQVECQGCGIQLLVPKGYSSFSDDKAKLFDPNANLLITHADGLRVSMICGKKTPEIDARAVFTMNKAKAEQDKEFSNYLGSSRTATSTLKLWHLDVQAKKPPAIITRFSTADLGTKILIITIESGSMKFAKHEPIINAIIETITMSKTGD